MSDYFPKAKVGSSRIASEMKTFKFAKAKTADQLTPKRHRANTLYGRIRSILSDKRTDGKPGTRLDAAADAYVSQMESGSFIHLKEIIDRQEGKIPNRIANADGTNLKAYIGIPVDGPDAP